MNASRRAHANYALAMLALILGFLCACSGLTHPALDLSAGFMGANVGLAIGARNPDGTFGPPAPAPAQTTPATATK